MTLRAVFAGTPDFAVPALEALLNSGAEVVAVYCQPDRPAGRGRKLRPCAVKTKAMEHAIPIRQPAHLEHEADTLEEMNVDLAIVAAYGLLLPESMLGAPRLGCINVHASLLPRWRGAAPIQRAIEAGDAKTGITLMKMDAGLDTGPIIQTREIPIQDTEHSQSLHDRLSALGGKMVFEFLENLGTETIRTTPQPETGMTYARQLTREEAWLDWRRPAEVLERQIRAFNPWPLARTTLEGIDYRIHQARSHPDNTATGPGTITVSGGGALQVQTGEGVLEVLTLQRPGGKALNTPAFLNGHPIRSGSVFALPRDRHAER